jgi:hypothetical protein
MNEASSGLFRFIAGLARHQVVASTIGSFGILIFMLLGGFLLSRGMQKELIQQYCFWMKYLCGII